MSKRDSEITERSAKKLFLGTLPLMILIYLAKVLLLCGWLLRDDGWQTQFEIGRWMWFMTSILSVLTGLPLLIWTLLKKKKLKFLTWCRKVSSLLLSLAGTILLLQHSIVAAIYVIFIGNIVSSALDASLEKISIVKRFSIATCIVSIATIVAFTFEVAALVFLLIIVELLVLSRGAWIGFYDTFKNHK